MTSLNGTSHNSGSGTPKSLFPRGPSFTLDNFSNKDFIVRDFIEELSETAVPINRRSGPAQQGTYLGSIFSCQIPCECCLSPRASNLVRIAMAVGPRQLGIF